jgi:hypothetical protein
MAGRCEFGDACKFLHDGIPRPPPIPPATTSLAASINSNTWPVAPPWVQRGSSSTEKDLQQQVPCVSKVHKDADGAHMYKKRKLPRPTPTSNATDEATERKKLKQDALNKIQAAWIYMPSSWYTILVVEFNPSDFFAAANAIDLTHVNFKVVDWEDQPTETNISYLAAYFVDRYPLRPAGIYFNEHLVACGLGTNRTWRITAAKAALLLMLEITCPDMELIKDKKVLEHVCKALMRIPLRPEEMLTQKQ